MKRCFVLFFIFALTLCFQFIPEVKAQGYGDRTKVGGAGSYRIKGRVLLPNGYSAVGIKISLNSADFVDSYAITDKDGNFSFESLLAGNYVVSVKENESFVPETETVIIGREAPGGQSFSVLFNLRVKTNAREKNEVLDVTLTADVPKEALEIYDKAVEKIGKKDLKSALQLLDKSIQIYPQFAAAHNEKGLLFLKQNDLDKALEAFSRAVQAKPDYFEAKLNYGFTLLSMKDYIDSEKVFRDVLNQKSDVSTAHLYLGISLLGLNKIEEAERSFKNAISLKKGENLAQAHKYLGGIYWQKNQYKEALTELEKYLELSPGAADADKIKATIDDLKKKI